MDAESERPPGGARQAAGVSHAESWRQNICSPKLVFAAQSVLD